MKNEGTVKRETGAATTLLLRAMEQRILKLNAILASIVRNNQLVLDHNDMSNLAYADSGHTGFTSAVTHAAHTGDSTIHFTEGSIDHTAITNVGTNAHSVIDSHIADVTTNPHRVTAAQVGAVPSYNQSAEPGDPGGVAFWRDTDDGSIHIWSGSAWEKIYGP